MHSGEQAPNSEAKEIEVVVEGPQVAIYPVALADKIDLRASLKAEGVAVGDGRVVVSSEVSDSPFGYAMTITPATAQVVEMWRREGRKVLFTTPLSECVNRAITNTKQAKTVAMRLESGTGYIAVAEEHRLLYAEAMPLASEEEIVGLLAQLNRDFELRRALFALSGADAPNYRKLVKRYFRRVECEKRRK